MKRILTTALFVGFSSLALAAPNFLYTVPLGTVSHYKSISVNQTSFADVTVSNEDGTPVKKTFQDAFMAGFKDFNSTTKATVTETVIEVLTDGTRVVDATNIASVETTSGTINIPAQTLKFLTTTAYLANGQVQLQALKYDRSTLPQSMTESVIESLEQDLKSSLSSPQPSIYGRGYELNQPLLFEYNIQNSAFGSIDAKVNGTRTLTAVGAQGQLEFQIQTNTSAYTAKLEFEALPDMVSEYEFPASSLNSIETYLPDGRLEHSSSSAVTTYKFKTSLKLLDQKMVISGTASSTLENSSDLMN
jgi:hypothetical protein